MQIFNAPNEMQQWCLEQKKQGKSIGLVPTMGYLHEGHLALVREARRRCEIVVVSVFVNPIQFNVGQDFEDYPRNLEHDSDLLEKEQVNAIFAPTIKSMYPSGYNSFVEVLGEMTEKLCGASRPGHFRGVTTVVSKLFHVCMPDLAFFGQKDAQQALIIEKMVKDLNFPLSIVRVPIVRESDGLALSSRNVHLNAEQRQAALVLSRVLKEADSLIAGGEKDVAVVKSFITRTIEAVPQARIDYAEIYRADDLGDLEKIGGRIIIALAVWFGTTRLIDNLLVEV
jgi:pantoate--beta-alanine ligase